MEAKFKDTTVIPRPDNWGGYRLTPDYFEFYTARDNFINDRISFTLNSDGKWAESRMLP